MSQDYSRQVVADRSRPVITMPCALCGAPVPHQAVGPHAIAKLMFRATVHRDVVWLPAQHSRSSFGQLLCPDPPPDTKSFWDDDRRRENYKAARREEARRRIGWTQ